MGGRGALLLLRHGQSVSNAADVFTGWSDPALSDLGEAQARGAGSALRRLGLRPTSVHTSLLLRSIATAEIVLGVLGRDGCRCTARGGSTNATTAP